MCCDQCRGKQEFFKSQSAPVQVQLPPVQHLLGCVCAASPMSHPTAAPSSPSPWAIPADIPAPMESSSYFWCPGSLSHLAAHV